MKIFALVAGGLGVLLGGLWLLQGLGIVHLRPLLCFANCEPVQGPSILWAIVGALMLIAGIVAVRFARAAPGRRVGRTARPRP